MSSATCLPTSTPVTKTEVVVAPSHRALIDVARLAAAYGIIWLHTPRFDALGASRSIGRFAVPFFVFSTVFFVFEGLARRPERTFGQYARLRFVRIYLPFLAWSVIYLGFKLVKGFLLPEQPNDYPGLEILWTGGFYHLWFLPFILVVSLLAFVTAKATAGRGRAELAVAIAGAVAGTVLAVTPTPGFVLRAGTFAGCVTNALPAVCWALALGIAVRHPATRVLERPAATIAGLLLVVASTAWVWRFGGAKLPETLAGLGVMVAALGPARTVWIGRLARLGPLAYGIYFAHMLFIKVLEAVAVRLDAPVTWQQDVTVVLIAAAASTLLARALSRRAATRWLVA